MDRKRAFRRVLWLTLVAIVWPCLMTLVHAQEAPRPGVVSVERQTTESGRPAFSRVEEPALRRGLFEAWKAARQRERGTGFSPEAAQAAATAVGRASIVINSSGTIFYTRQTPGSSCDPDPGGCAGNVNCPTWQLDNSYNAGDIVRATGGANGPYWGLLFQAQNSGLSGLTEPSWPILAGGTVVDNTVTWTAIGFAAATLTGCTATQIVSHSSSGVETVLASEGDTLSDGTQLSGWAEFLAANDSGLVSFKAEQVGRPINDDEGRAVIMEAGPGPGGLTRIADSPITVGVHNIFGYSSMVAMNNAGQVVFDGYGPFTPGSSRFDSTPAWAPSTAYNVGNTVIPTSGVPLLRFVAETAGTSGAVEPTWPATVGQTVSDVNIVWKAEIADGDENNHTLIRYTPGIGNEVLIGQGDFVPPDFNVDGFGNDVNTSAACTNTFTGGGCQYDNFDGRINSAGHVPVVITSVSIGQVAYLLTGPGTNMEAARTGGAGPGGAFGTIFPRINLNDNDQMVFVAMVGGVKKILRWTPPSTFAVVASVGDDIGTRSGGPPSGVTISDLGYFADINNPGNIVFQARLAGGPDPLGYFFWDGSTGNLTTVVTGADFTGGSIAPPGGGRYRPRGSIGSQSIEALQAGFFGLAAEMITLNDSNAVAFVNGSSSPEQSTQASEAVEDGLYFWTKAGGPVKVVAVGDMISGNTVSSVYAQHTSFVKRQLNSSGCAVVRYYIAGQAGDSDEEEGSGPNNVGTPPGGQLLTTCGFSCPPITVSPPTLPGGTQGTAYSQTITASPASSYTFAVTSGALPAGLTLTAGGVLSGTPTVSGTFNFTITATDPNACTGSQAYSLVIVPPTGCQPPPAPSLGVNPSTANIGQTVTLTWTSTIAAGQGSYTVQVSINGNGFFTIGSVAASGSPTQTFKYRLTNPGTYDFQVLAVPSCNPALFSTSNVARTFANGPCANAPIVTGVTVTPTSALAGATFTVTWNPASGFSGVYGVFRSTDGGQTFTQIGTTSGTSFTGTVSGLAGATLTFEVEALGCIYSQKSNFATLTILGSIVCDPPNAVTNVQISAFGVTPPRPPSPIESFVVSWTPPASGTAPTQYGVQINGDQQVLVPAVQGLTAQQVTFAPRGTPDPITAFVTPYGCPSLSSAELFDPTAGAWSITAGLGVPRQEHTATGLGSALTAFPSGRVLVAGGLPSSSTSVPVPLATGTAEIYDATSASWSSTGSLATPRSFHGANLLNNSQVLVEGGSSDTSQILSSSELYDPVSRTWSTAGSLATARVGQTATLLSNGNVLVVGGLSGTPLPAELSSSELYDPSTKSWTATGSLANPRFGHTATLLTNGKVLVVGGRDAAGVLSSTGGVLSSAELYDPASGTWTSTGSLGTAREYHTATLLDSGKVLVAGGDDGTLPLLAALSSAELYDPSSGTWSATGNLVTARKSNTATLLSNGQVLMAGGLSCCAIQVGSAPDPSLSLLSAEIYDPTAGTFSATGSLNGGHGLATATLLSSGKVLLAGGADDRGQKAGPTASSGVVALFLTPPAASFTISANPTAGAPVTFTDTSSPQATSWLWIFDDGTTSTVQSPTHTFTTAGTHQVSLIASNSAGSSTATQTFTVAAASSSTPVLARSAIAVDASAPGRQRAHVDVPGMNATFLRVRSLESVETIVFLRFLDAGGRLVLERRLSVMPGTEGAYDLGAWGRTGSFTIELVSVQRFSAALSAVGRPSVREVVR